MEDKRKQFLAECRKAIDNVKQEVLSIEEAASHLVSLILRDNGLLKYPEIENIFSYLSDADIPREVSHALPIGSWNEKAADRMKEQEWAHVVAAVQYAERINGETIETNGKMSESN